MTAPSKNLAPVVDDRGDALLEAVSACPLCGSDAIEQLAVENIVSRDPEHARRVVEALDGRTFPLGQRLGVCTACGLAFQSTRPTGEGLSLLYDRFATALGKVQPSSERMFHYLFVDNAKDYVDGVAGSLAFLDRHGLTDGITSAFELRTYGGGLVGLLKERGVQVGAAYIQDFDADAARRLHDLDDLVPFSFGDDIAGLTPPHESYDLVVTYEGLTHSRSIPDLLDWLDRHLASEGVAVSFREPDTPAYRDEFTLDTVFNNFHLHLLDAPRLRDLFERDGRFSVTAVREHHPRFANPLYLTLILRRSATPTQDIPGGDGAYGLPFYRAWMERDASPTRRRAVALRKDVEAKARRALGRSKLARRLYRKLRPR